MYNFFYFQGYAGYISGVKSENLFGRTYGKITYESATQTIHRGVDLSADLKYTSEAKGNYIDQKDFKKREVQKRQEIENKQNVHQGIPISQIYKFFAYEDKYSQHKTDYEPNELSRTQNLYTDGSKGFQEAGNTKTDDKYSTKLTYEEASKIAHLG